MALLPWQFQYGLLVIGDQTSYGVMTADWSMPDVTINSQARTREDGYYPGLDLAQKRPITFECDIPNLGDGNYYANRETWRDTFTMYPNPPVLPLIMMIEGYSAQRRFYARPRKRSTPENNVSASSLSTWTVMLEADDPLQYSDAQTTVGPSSSISVPNAGNYPAGAGTTPQIVELVVTGTNPVVTSSNGGSLSFTGTGTWGVDLGLHAVSGGVNGYADLVQPATWFWIDPNGITISCSGGTVACTTRDAWL
jgi:hypothetical protein